MDRPIHYTVGDQRDWQVEHHLAARQDEGFALRDSLKGVVARELPSDEATRKGGITEMEGTARDEGEKPQSCASADPTSIGDGPAGWTPVHASSFVIIAALYIDMHPMTIRDAIPYEVKACFASARVSAGDQ